MKPFNPNRTIAQLKSAGVVFAEGLSDAEIQQLEERFEVAFPPDLKAFYQTALPISSGFVQWRAALNSEAAARTVQRRFDWPWEGLVFDLQHNTFWHPDWGPEPATLDEKKATARQFYLTYPQLIPLYSHCYLPARPHAAGNPVFSVYQMDIIYYGVDLTQYFANEFGYSSGGAYDRGALPERKIEFWSGIAEE